MANYTPYPLSVKILLPNVSEEVSVIDITFDTSPPEIAIEKPQSESFVNSNQITFSVNEPFTSAKMIWQGKGLGFIGISKR